MADARPSISNDDVPLAFLLGRRASEYLPSLRQTSQTRRAASVTQLDDNLWDRGGHVRRREEQAQRLLERVLAKEVRTGKKQGDEALEPPLERVTSADRRYRAEELQRVLKELQSEFVNEHEEKGTDTTRRRAVTDLYFGRERFSSSHGYIPSAIDFVDIVGSRVTVKVVKNLKEVNEEDKRNRVKHVKVKQARVRRMQQVLQEQQAETKTKSRQLLLRQKAAASDQNGVKVTPEPEVKVKQQIAQQRRQTQDEELKKVEEEKQREDQSRRERVHQARLEGEAARRERRSAIQHEKKTLAKLKSVGPSFVSALRLDGVVNTPQNIDKVTPTLSLDTQLESGETFERDEKSECNKESHSKLQVRQRDLFLQSRSRTLQFGGGFSSTPQDVGTRVDAVQANDLYAEAHSLPPSKSRREVLDALKSTLLSQ